MEKKWFCNHCKNWRNDLDFIKESSEGLYCPNCWYPLIYDKSLKKRTDMEPGEREEK